MLDTFLSVAVFIFQPFWGRHSCCAEYEKPGKDQPESGETVRALPPPSVPAGVLSLLLVYETVAVQGPSPFTAGLHSSHVLRFGRANPVLSSPYHDTTH